MFCFVAFFPPARFPGLFPRSLKPWGLQASPLLLYPSTTGFSLQGAGDYATYIAEPERSWHILVRLY